MRDVAVGDRLDGFEITDLIARGAMGSVFRAIDTASGRTVDLKVPHVQYESDVVFFERIRREEQIGRDVDHPNVVRVLEPQEKSRFYVAMEFVEGRSLASLLREGPLRAEKALDIGRQVCAGLAALHARGIVHRDLKPENIHLTAGGQVKILDFGIALLPSARRLTWAGLSAVLGTPDYMAPEQIRGRRGDARTDVYAVGTLLYEMLTGKLPFEAPNPAAVMRAKLEDRPTSPARYVLGLDPPLEATILRAIERDPRDRHASASELLDDLTSPSGIRRPDVLGARRPSPRRAARVIGVCVSVSVGLILLGIGSFL
jgi:serine/threonine protein kinase